MLVEKQSKIAMKMDEATKNNHPGYCFGSDLIQVKTDLALHFSKARHQKESELIDFSTKNLCHPGVNYPKKNQRLNFSCILTIHPG